MRVDRVKLASSMARLDLNCKAVAERAGISRGTVTAVKSGKSCSAETVRKLVSVLGEEIVQREAK